MNTVPFELLSRRRKSIAYLLTPMRRRGSHAARKIAKRTKKERRPKAALSISA
jgi:hypothetical protein